MPKKNKDMAFEERLARLQVIVAALENGDAPLEESVELYKEGLSHAAACREQLAAARHEIEVFSEGTVSPFEPEKISAADSVSDRASGDISGNVFDDSGADSEVLDNSETVKAWR